MHAHVTQVVVQVLLETRHRVFAPVDGLRETVKVWFWCLCGIFGETGDGFDDVVGGAAREYELEDFSYGEGFATTAEGEGEGFEEAEGVAALGGVEGVDFSNDGGVGVRFEIDYAAVDALGVEFFRVDEEGFEGTAVPG